MSLLFDREANEWWQVNFSLQQSHVPLDRFVPAFHAHVSRQSPAFRVDIVDALCKYIMDENGDHYISIGEFMNCLLRFGPFNLIGIKLIQGIFNLGMNQMYPWYFGPAIQSTKELIYQNGPGSFCIRNRHPTKVQDRLVCEYASTTHGREGSWRQVYIVNTPRGYECQAFQAGAFYNTLADFVMANSNRLLRPLVSPVSMLVNSLVSSAGGSIYQNMEALPPQNVNVYDHVYPQRSMMMMGGHPQQPLHFNFGQPLNRSIVSSNESDFDYSGGGGGGVGVGGGGFARQDHRRSTSMFQVPSTQANANAYDAVTNDSRRMSLGAMGLRSLFKVLQVKDKVMQRSNSFSGATEERNEMTQPNLRRVVSEQNQRHRISPQPSK